MPGPEGNRKAEPREEENTTMYVPKIEDGNRPRLVVDGVDIRGGPKI